MNEDSEDFFSIGMGFVTPGVETGVPASDTSEPEKCCDKTDICSDIKENCEKADKSIQEDKDKNEIVFEAVQKDNDDIDENESNSSESYLDREKRIKTFSLEEAFINTLVTENINSATNKELKTIGNLLILTRKACANYKVRQIEDENVESPSQIILNNLINTDSTVNTHFSYLKYKTNSLETVYSNILEFVNSFSTSGDVGENITTLQLLGSDVLNLFDTAVPGFSAKVYAGDKSITEELDKINKFLGDMSGFEYVINNLFGISCVNKDAPTKSIVDSIEAINVLLKARNDIINLNLSDKFETSIDNISKITSHNDISVDYNDKLVLEKVTKFVYKFTKIVTETIQYFSEDVKTLYDSTVDSIKIGKEEESK